MIRIVRTTSQVRDSRGTLGRRLYVSVQAEPDHAHAYFTASAVFPAIERGEPYIHMPAGNHEWVMDRTRLSGPKLISVIRFLDVPIYRNERWEKNNSLLIHVGNWPYQLRGCVAPGLRQTNTGVGRSALAMEAIFTLLGGFRVGKKGIATVENEQGPPTDG